MRIDECVSCCGEPASNLVKSVYVAERNCVCECMHAYTMGGQQKPLDLSQTLSDLTIE